MSTSTKTVAERFRGYANEASDLAMAHVYEDGLDAPLCEWLRTHPTWHEHLADAMADAADRLLRSRKDECAGDASDTLKEWLRARCEAYLEAWSDAQREEFMAQIDAETAEAKRLDLAEGNDD